MLSVIKPPGPVKALALSIVVFTLLVLFGVDIPRRLSRIVINNGDGTVTDKNTGLMWQQETGKALTWKNALAYCENLYLAGYSNWRLPTLYELKSIVDYNKASPAIATVYFPGTTSITYWSSTNSDTSYVTGVEFGHGGCAAIPRSSVDCVRAVRSIAPAVDPPSPPFTPTLNSAKSNGKTMLSWTNAGGATGYNLYYAPWFDADTVKIVDMGTQTTLSIDSQHNLYVAVKAYNRASESELSNVVVIGEYNGVTIGIVSDFSGLYAEYFAPSVNAAEIVVAHVNSLGGVLGQPVSLVKKDDKCKINDARDLASQLIIDGIDGIIAHSCSEASISALDIYKDAGVVTVSPSVSSSDFTLGDEYPNFFITNPKYMDQVQLQVKYAVEILKTESVAILHDRGDYGKGLALKAKKYFAEAGIALSIFEGITPGAVDYSAIVNKVKRTDPDLVVWCGYHQEASRLVKQMARKECDALFMAGAGVMNASFLNDAGKYAENVYVTGQIDFSHNPLSKMLRTAHLKSHGSEPGPSFYYVSAATFALLGAIEKAGSTEETAIITALRTDEFDTPFGKIKFDENGAITGPGIGYSVYKVEGGEFNEIYKLKSTIHQSTYELIQWPSRRDDTYYCIDICNNNCNVHDGFKELQCGEGFYSWSPKKYINNVLGIPDSDLNGLSLKWRVRSQSGYGEEGFEGVFTCSFSDIDDPTGDDPTGDDPTGDDPTGDDPTGDDPVNEGSAEVDDVITMENTVYDKHTKGLCQFSHKKHFEVYAIACGECHHDANGAPLVELKPGDAVRNCSVCHTRGGRQPGGISDADKLDFHRNAIHNNCIACHKKYNKENKTKDAPASCKGCHPKKKQ